MVKNGYRSIKTQKAFLSLKEGDIVIVCDTETTGFSAEKDRVLEFSAEKFLVKKDYEIELLDGVQIYINPQFPIPPKVTEIHGITDEFVSDKPIEDEVFDAIYKWTNDAIICGHNVAFDNRFISAMYKRRGLEYTPKLVLDTLEAAKDFIDAKTVPNNKLETVASVYGADKGMVFHTAKDDVHVCGKLLQIFLDEYKEAAGITSETSLSSEPRTAEEMLASIMSRKAELPKRLPYIKGMELKVRHHSNNNRLYFYTDCGSIWYDRYNKCWGHNPEKMKVPFETIDMEAFIKRVLWLTKVETEADLTKVKTEGAQWFRSRN